MGDIMKNIICLVLSSVVIFTSIVFCQIDNASSSEIHNSDNLTIIIDAGHGGEDGGAIADDGTVEKDLNLSVALKLNDILSVFGYKTHLIRTTDISVYTQGDTIRERKISDIKNRINVMNEYENCLYISVHQNKFTESYVHGAQTFYSPNNAESKILAEFIQKSISSGLQKDNDRAVKKSGTDIYILFNAQKPTVMVECGFISNPDELINLKNSQYQNKMAMSVAAGIINYNISEEKNGTQI